MSYVNPEQFEQARSAVERVTATDPTSVNAMSDVLRHIYGISASVGDIVMARGVPPCKEYDQCHLGGEEAQASHVIRHPLGRTCLIGYRTYFAATKSAVGRGSYMATYRRIGHESVIKSDVLLPGEFESIRLCSESPDAYETDGDATYARRFGPFGKFEGTFLSGSTLQSGAARLYFTVVQDLSKHLLDAIDDEHIVSTV